MSGGGGSQSSTTDETQDYIDWLKPTALGYRREGVDLSNTQYQPYGGFFQGVTAPTPTFQGWNATFDRPGNMSSYKTLGANEYTPLAFGGKDQMRLDTARASNPDYKPRFMSQADYRTWRKSTPDWRTQADQPFVLRGANAQRYARNRALEARQRQQFGKDQANRLPPNQISAIAERMKAQGYDLGKGMTSGGSIVDYMNREMLGQNVAPWSEEQAQAMAGTGKIARENISGGDTNREMRDWLRGLFADNLDKGENPFLQQVIDRAQNDQNRAWEQVIKPRMDSSFARSNAFGGSAWSQANAEAERAQGQELGRISEDVRYRDWADRQANRLHAAGLLSGGAAADSRYRDLAALSGVGEQKQGYSQRLMDEAYQNWQGAKQQPYQNLDVLGRVLGLLQSETGHNVSKTKTSGGGGDMLGGIASGLLSLGTNALLPGSGSVLSSTLGNLFQPGRFVNVNPAFAGPKPF